MPMPLDRFQGRDLVTGKTAMGHGPMFSRGFRAGRTRAEDAPAHFVRMSGFTHSHDAGPPTPHGEHPAAMNPGAGVDCAGCMATAARMRQWIEGLRRRDGDPPAHERWP